MGSLKIQLDRIRKYYPKNKPKGFQKKEDQKEEGKFQRLIFKGERNIKDKLRELDIENTMESFSFDFHSEKIASLIFKDTLCEFSDTIRAKVEALEIDWDYMDDKRFFINIPKKEVPDWNHTKHFWEQEKESLQFYIGEYNKIKKGFYVGDYFVHPWLYFHINFFKTNIPTLNDRGVIEEVVKNVDFRRTEWYFAEILKKAEEKKSGAIFLYGSRRIGKALKNDEPLYYEDGERPIGEAKVGDKIYDANGKLTNIIGVYPQGKIDLYKVEFGDGRSICML